MFLGSRDAVTAKSRVEGRERSRRRPRTGPSREFLERREELVTAAAAVFRRRGYDAGTLDDVARALDLSRATVYHYVQSKSALLHLVFSRVLDLELGPVADHPGHRDPAARLAALIRHQVRLVTSQPALFSVFFEERYRLDARYEEEIRIREAEYVAVFEEAVNAAQAAGVMAGIDPRRATESLFGMTNWCHAWFVPGRDDAERVSDTIVALLLER
jgi:AcrR family transcriptional regulator